MMLWRKAWRESRTRFVMALTVRVAICAWLLLEVRSGFPPPQFPQLPFTAFVWAHVFGNMQPVLFAMMALLLGLGGLQRERAAGTAAFTLVLPLTRTRLETVRAAMGLTQVVALAFLPAVLVPPLVRIAAGHEYPFSQAVGFSALHLAWGTIFYALGFLWATLLRGTYTPVVACVLTPFVYLVATDRWLDDPASVKAANFAAFMSGMPYFDATRGGESVLGLDFPWPSIIGLIAVATLILTAAIWSTRRQDF